jgi:ABC-type polysaccharide/polyol phosphate export permease
VSELEGDVGDLEPVARSAAAKKRLTVAPRRNDPWSYRYLIWNFAQRDLKAKYKGTTVGWAWSLLVPAAVVLIYTLVFAVIFRAEPPDFGTGRAGVFAVWFIVGLVPWSFFSASLTTGMPSLLGAGALLQKVFIPSYVPVLGTVTSVLVQTCIEFGLVLAILAAFGNIGWSWLLLPLWMALFTVFTASVAYALAVLNVFMRDLSQIIAVALQLLFFTTPIIYPITLIPETYGSIPLQTVILANPLAQFIIGFRDILYGLGAPDLGSLAYVSAWTLAALGVCVLAYRWRGRDVSEEI